MSFVMAAVAVVGAGVSIWQAVEGQKAADAAAEEARLARIEMDRHKEAFEALDTSNPYTNMTNMYDTMENKMEDLTVNQQQAEFEKQQAIQSQANIMGQMRGAAGSSGIASLAQTLANQGALQAQRASASIGLQEAANQKAAAAEASRIQGLQLGEDARLQGLYRQGELQSRQMEAQKIESLMALSAGDVASAQAMQAAGQQQMMEGASSAVDYGMQAGGAISNRSTGDTITPTQRDWIANPVTQAEVDSTGFDGTPEEFTEYVQNLDLSTFNLSDRRLKKDIKRIGISPSGLNIYSFKYINTGLGEEVYQGVMSDEIPSKHVHKLGVYDMVDYSGLDVEFKKL